jgi:hypothetical protein
MKARNPYGRMRPVSDPYEVWSTPDGSWTWKILKYWKSPELSDLDPYARVFCHVTSPYVPDGELGDVYLRAIKGCAVRVHKEVKA